MKKQSKKILFLIKKLYHIFYLNYSFYIFFILSIVIVIALINSAISLHLKNPQSKSSVQGKITYKNLYSIKSYKPKFRKHYVNNFKSDYDVKPSIQHQGTVRIPILTYHHIDSLPDDPKTRPFYVTKEMFDTQMRYFYDKKYRTISPKEFSSMLSSGKNPKQKTVMLTFDDGYLDNYLNAFPILKKYHFKGVFYIYTDRIFITNAQLAEMTKAGMIIESHSASHSDLTKIFNKQSLYRETRISKTIIEQITGKTVQSLSYPGCATNSYVMSIVQSTGYKLALSCGKSIDHFPQNKYMISRVHVFNDFYSFQQRLSGVWVATRYDQL